MRENATADIGVIDKRLVYPYDRGELVGRIRESRGAEFERRLYEKKFQIYPFIKNCNELENTIDRIESQIRGEMFLLGGDELEMHLFSLEVVRLLFNAVAAAFMLVDYLRNFMRSHYENTNAHKNYDKLVLSVAKDEVCCFVKELRNAATHAGNPAQMILRKRTREGVTTKVLFDGDGLLSRYSRWSARSKEFIRVEMERPEEFSVRRIVSDYRAKMQELHQQIDYLLITNHASDMEELRLLREDLNSRFPGHYGWPMLPIDAALPPMDYP